MVREWVETSRGEWDTPFKSMFKLQPILLVMKNLAMKFHSKSRSQRCVF